MSVGFSIGCPRGEPLQLLFYTDIFGGPHSAPNDFSSLSSFYGRIFKHGFPRFEVALLDDFVSVSEAKAKRQRLPGSSVLRSGQFRSLRRWK